MAKSPDPNEPKLIIDDDWKSRVQREKEQADAAPAPVTQGDRDMEFGGEGQGDGQMPPPTFEFLVSSFYMQALSALGMIPDPVTQQPQEDRIAAKHLIDLLAMLDEKTKGNLAPNEVEMMSQIQHQLRMLYLNPDAYRKG